MIKIESKIIDQSVKKVEKKLKRPECLHGPSIKISTPNYSLYMTINTNNGVPFEVFFNASGMEDKQWVEALALVISGGLRSCDSTQDVHFYAKQLMKVHSPQGYHTGGKGGWVPSVVFHIGKTLLRYNNDAFMPEDVGEYNHDMPALNDITPEVKQTVVATGTECPKCHEFTLIKEGGCERCTNDHNEQDEPCGYMGECG